MEHSEFRHSIPIQVRFSDIDRLNHVNNACYHNYFELARVKYFNEVLNDRIKWDSNGFVLARTEIDHILPVYLEDELTCFTKVTAIGTKSLTIKNLLMVKKENGWVLSAACTGILVAMNYKLNESMPVPAEWRRMFLDFEGSIHENKK
jgi:acyl-CoA thioester hydrolase